MSWEQWAIIGALVSAFFSAVSAGVSATQTYFTARTIEAPFEANLQAERILVCSEILSGLNEWTKLLNMQTVIAADESFAAALTEERLEEAVEDVAELLRDSGYTKRDALFVRAELIFPNPSEFQELGILFSQVSDGYTQRLMRFDEDTFRSMTKSGSAISDSDWALVSEAYLSKLEEVKFTCRALSLTQVN